MIKPISSTEIAEYYRELDEIGRLQPGLGYLRAAFSNEETAAMRYIERLAQREGGQSRWDAIGNLVIEWHGSTGKFLESASHIDTVPQGGNFDGAAGVIAGLAAVTALKRSGVPLRHGLRLRVWRGEESATFNATFIGSLSACGKFNQKQLSYKFRGITLEDAIRSQGGDVDLLLRGERTIGQPELDSIIGHVELHIEQGNVLEIQGVDLGVVTSIRGPKRLRVTLRGDFDHSGATPMGVKYRRDVNLALAYIMVELDTLCANRLGAGDDLVQTIGVINSNRELNDQLAEVYQNGVPKVSGFGYFCLDMRSSNSATLAEYAAAAEGLIHQVAARYRVQVEIELLGQSSPLETLDAALQAALESTAQKLGYSSIRMPSGAGHDAAILGAEKRSDGSRVPVAMLFIPCRRGKSHCPEEYATFDSIAKGATTIANTFEMMQ
jgi:hydantoinase/carbamoylase family amidase